MGHVKYAAAAIQDAWMGEQATEPGFRVRAHRHEFAYDPRPGYVYVRSRAISSRCNDNYDEFPAEEIKQSYRSFVGKPVFVNHHNDDHRRARGVVIDAALHEDVNPDGSPDTWAEVLMEVDAVRFPMLARAILAGEIDRTSMGTDVAYSVCSACGNQATTPAEYCTHIPRLKGRKYTRHNASTGQSETVLIREICHGLKFFENSLLVEEPADPTAYFLGVDDHSGLATTAAKEAKPKAKLKCQACRFAWREDFDNVSEVDCPRCGALMANGGVGYAMASTDKLAWGEKVRRKVFSPGTSSGIILDWIRKLPKKVQPLVQMVDGSDGSTIVMAEWPANYPYSATDYVRDPEWDALIPDRMWNVGETIEAKDLKVGDLISFQPYAGHGSDNTIDQADEVVEVSDRGFKLKGLPDLVGFTDYGGWSSGNRRTPKRVWRFFDRNGRPARRTGSKLGYGEQKAPPQVDTLKDEECPVCGENDSYNGDRCAVCGFVRPPEQFMDPDLDEAKENDLRQEGQPPPNGQPGQPDEPTDNEDLIFHPPADQQAPDEMPDEDTDEDTDEEPAEEDDEEDEDEEQDDDDQSSDQSPFPPKKRKKKGPVAEGVLSMRPSMQAVAEQQIIIEAQERRLVGLERAVVAIGKLAGLDDTVVHDLLQGRMYAKEDQAAKLSFLVRADENDPAQPVPQPGAEAPYETTAETLGDLNDADVTAPGATNVTDVSPEATTDVTTVGRRVVGETVLDEPLDLNEQDVTAPVEGTTDQRPLNETKIETDVRASEGDNTSTMFPMQGPFAEQPKTSGQTRTFASLRLARLRIQARIESGDDLELGERIATSDASDEAIDHEIETLSAVLSAKPPTAPPVEHVAARGVRSTPSFSSSAPSNPFVAGKVSEDELLFEG